MAGSLKSRFGCPSATALIDFLVAATKEPFVWGSHDCALFVADWVRAVTGRDAAAHLRGRYAGEREARALMGPLGLAGIVRTCALAAGLRRLPAAVYPPAGSIAVIAGARRVPVSAIAGPRGWMLRDTRGLVCIHPAEARAMCVFAVEAH